METAQEKPQTKGNLSEAGKKKPHVKILFFDYKRINGKSQRDCLAKGE